MKNWLGILLCVSSLAHANCTVYFNDLPLKENKDDPLFFLLSNAAVCPNNIQDLKQNMMQNELVEHVSMVANRGINNSVKGSFSFFESVNGQLSNGELVEKGEFYLGYFTRLKGTKIILDQQPKNNKLLIEVIAWDKQKQLYNFYELRGIANGSTRWFYRGDSTDAYRDNIWLYRESPKSEPHFGNRMRCSACHNSGGPILKEMAIPHNDWWTTKRPLILEPNNPDNEIQALLEQVIDADIFSTEVQLGADKLDQSEKVVHFQNNLSLQEQLRPLFCTNEINLESSSERLVNKVLIPSAFWLNPLLGQINLAVSVEEYNKLLEEFDMQFPETLLRDADHFWHTPVKGHADINAIKDLIKRQIISNNFAEAVLMIDYAHPLFSAQRCSLLKLLPDSGGEGWLSQFLINLQKKGDNREAALQLAEYLGNDKHDHDEFMRKIELYRQSLARLIATSSGLRASYQQLIALRRAVYTSELSQNPAGEILEPGFRVVFPESRI